MRELEPNEVSIHRLIPFPGTPYYENPASHGITIFDKKDFECFAHADFLGNVVFDYLTQTDLERLVESASLALESLGYVRSDLATPGQERIYSVPRFSGTPAGAA